MAGKSVLDNSDRAPVSAIAGDRGVEVAEPKLTKAMRRFLAIHTYPGFRGYRTRFDARRHGFIAYPLISRARRAGLINIVCRKGEFPYSWTGTRITPAGRAALAKTQAA